MNNSISNRILKSEPVKWKELLPIQGKNFKELSEASYLKLKHSMKENQFIAPFAVWQAKDGKIYTLDGVHRCRVLLDLENEGMIVPVILPANFIDAKDRREAAKLLLVYSSAYAKVTDDGLYEFLELEGLNFDELNLDIELDILHTKQEIDLEKEWQGMPEFHPEAKAFKSLTIHFETEEKFKEFIKKIGIELDESINSLWYPLKKRQKSESSYISES